MGGEFSEKFDYSSVQPWHSRWPLVTFQRHAYSLEFGMKFYFLAIRMKSGWSCLRYLWVLWRNWLGLEAMWPFSNNSWISKLITLSPSDWWVLCFLFNALSVSCEMWCQTLSLVGRGGYLYPLAEKLSQTPLGPFKSHNAIDRFFLGGMSSIRGFEERGAGPRAGGISTMKMELESKKTLEKMRKILSFFVERDDWEFITEHSLGGDLIAEFSGSLTSSLPAPFPEFIKTHLFVDAGSTGGMLCVNAKQRPFFYTERGRLEREKILTTFWTDNWEELKQGVRVGAGGGVVITGLGCRIEVNLINRITHWSFDRFRGYEVRFTPDMN